MSASAIVLCALGTGVGAVVQGVYGFGFALVAAPLLAAVLRPQEAVALLAVSGVAVSALVLCTTPAAPAGPATVMPRVLPAAAAGLPLGALLWLVPDDALRLGVCAVSALAAAALLRVPDPDADATRSSPLRTAGLLAGAMTTSTGINGPPLVLAFVRAGLPPAALRRALAWSFLLLDAAAIVLLATLGGGVVPPAAAVLAAAGAAGVGALASVPLRALVPEHRFHRDVLVLVVLAALAGAVVVVV